LLSCLLTVAALFVFLLSRFSTLLPYSTLFRSDPRAIATLWHRIRRGASGPAIRTWEFAPHAATAHRRRSCRHQPRVGAGGHGRRTARLPVRLAGRWRR